MAYAVDGIFQLLERRDLRQSLKFALAPILSRLRHSLAPGSAARTCYFYANNFPT